jgi:aspartate aminotransferase
VIWSKRLSRVVREVPRSGTVASRARADAAKARGVPVIRIIGSPRDVPPEHVREAVRAAANEHINAPSNGLPDLRAAIAAKLVHDNGISVDPETELLVTNGARQALHVVFAALLDPEDEVVIPTPSYTYDPTILMLRGVPKHALMSEVEGYRLDIERIEAVVTARTKALLINSPVNPTGHVATRDELEAIGDLARRRDLVVVADQAHERLIFDSLEHVSIGSLTDMSDRVVTIHSMSKAYCLMGYRVGYAAGDPLLIERARNVLEWTVLNNNFVSQRAALAALTGPPEWLDELVVRCERARDRIADGLAQIPGLTFVRPQGATTFFLNVTNFTKTAAEFTSFVLEHYGVPTAPGPVFGEEGHVRLTAIGSTDEDIDAAISALGEACRALVARGPRADSRWPRA